MNEARDDSILIDDYLGIVRKSGWQSHPDGETSRYFSTDADSQNRKIRTETRNNGY